MKPLLILLEKTYNSKTTEEVKQAQLELEKYDNYIEQRLITLIPLFYLNTIDLNLKNALSIRIKQVIINRNKKSTYDIVQLKEIISNIINPLINIETSNTKLDLKVLEQMRILLNNLLSTSILINEEPKLNLELVNTLVKKINNKNLYIVLDLFIVILNSKLTNSINLKEISDIYFEIISKNYKDMSTKVAIFIKNSELLFLTMKKLNTFKLLTSDIILKITKLYFEDITKILNEYSKESNNIVTIANKALMENENTKKQEISRVNKQNELKGNLILIISLFIQFLNQSEIKDENLLKYLPTILKFCLKSLEDIAKSHLNYIQNYLVICNYQKVIYQTLFLMSRCLFREPFLSDFKNNYMEFIIKIIFPFLCRTEKENELIEEQPEVYYTELIDCMIDFKLKNIKTASGFLLSQIVERFNAKNILHYCFQMLNYNMNEIDERSLVKYDLLNNDLTKENLIFCFSNETLIDTSILFICILAQQTMLNLDLIVDLKNFLISNQKRFHDMTSIMIQFKICLLYGLFLDLFDLNKIKEKIFVENSLNFLIDLMLKYDNVNDINGISYQALYSFDQLIEDEKFKDIITFIVRGKIEKLIEMISYIKIDKFFDVISSIVTYLDLEDYIIKILNFTIERLKKDVELSNLKSNVLINKELILIYTILNHYYSDNYAEQFDKIINEPLIILLKNIEKIEFSDDVILILSGLCNMSISKISNIILENLEYIKIYVQSKDGLDKDLFKILNFIMLKDKENILITNEKYNNIIMEIFILLLDKIDEFNGEENIIYSLLIINIGMINNHNDDNNNNNINKVMLKDENAQKIIENVLNKLIDNINIYKTLEDVYQTYDIYLIYFYISIIYSSTINYNKIVISLISKTNFLNNLIKFSKILYNSDFFSSELVKYIILGLCSLLYDKDILKEIIICFKEFFLITFNLLNKQLAEESFKYKKITNFESKDKFVESDDENEENEENEDSLGQKIKNIIREAKFPLENIDEFKSFNNLVNNLNQIQETKEIISNILNSFNQEQKTLFEKIYNTKRINIDYNGMNMFVPRRLLKIKKNNSNA